MKKKNVWKSNLGLFLLEERDLQYCIKKKQKNKTNPKQIKKNIKKKKKRPIVDVIYKKEVF